MEATPGNGFWRAAYSYSGNFWIENEYVLRWKKKPSKSSECQWNYFKCQQSLGEWKMWNMVCKVLHISLIWIRLEFVFVWKTQSVRTKQTDMWHAEPADPDSLQVIEAQGANLWTFELSTYLNILYRHTGYVLCKLCLSLNFIPPEWHNVGFTKKKLQCNWILVI